jgi:hypothetical protein
MILSCQYKTSSANKLVDRKVHFYLLSETPPHWQKQQVVLLSNIKLIHASWIVAAFQQVTKETLSRGWEKACIKECVDNCRL